MTPTGGVGNRIFGGPGNDTLRGWTDIDLLRGNADIDLLRGNAGNDTLRGKAGNDQIFGGLGVDTISGGRGIDECHSPKHARGCNRSATAAMREASGLDESDVVFVEPLLSSRGQCEPATLR